MRLFSATTLLLACAGMLPAQQMRTTWRDYLGGSDSSHYSALKQIDRGNVNKLEMAWAYDTGDDPSYTFSPIVIDNIAYFAAKQGSLVAVDAATGKELWAHTSNGPAEDLGAGEASAASAEQIIGKAKTGRIAAFLSPRRASFTPSTPAPANWSIRSRTTGNST